VAAVAGAVGAGIAAAVAVQVPAAALNGAGAVAVHAPAPVAAAVAALAPAALGAGAAAAMAALAPAPAALGAGAAMAALAPAPAALGAGAAAMAALAPAALGAVAALLPIVPAAAVGLAGAGAPMIPNVQVRNNLMALQQQRDATIARERAISDANNAQLATITAGAVVRAIAPLFAQQQQLGQQYYQQQLNGPAERVKHTALHNILLANGVHTTQQFLHVHVCPNNPQREAAILQHCDANFVDLDLLLDLFHSSNKTKFNKQLTDSNIPPFIADLL